MIIQNIQPSYLTNDMDALRQFPGQDTKCGSLTIQVRLPVRCDMEYILMTILNGIVAIGALATFDSAHAIETNKLIQLRSGNPYYTPERINIYLKTDTIQRTIKEQLCETLGFYFHDPSKMKNFSARCFIKQSRMASY